MRRFLVALHGERIHGLAAGWVPALAAALVLSAAVPALAQNDNPVELQETDVFGMGARAMGMGMAYTAVSEDVSALAFNPAGLAQIRRIELSGGLANNDLDREMTHFTSRTQNLASTRLDHLAFAYPVPTYRGSLVLAVGFHRMADLDVDSFKEGFLVPIGENSPGLYELDQFTRQGAMNAWTAAAALDLSPNLSVGASVSYLSGNSREDLTTANYRATRDGDKIVLDLGNPDNPDDRLFREQTHRTANLDGYTGSVGILGYPGGGFRVAAVLDLPSQLTYDGVSHSTLEDWEKIDEFEDVFTDDITLPLSVRGGVSWGGQGLLVSGGLRWTDYSQIDYEGKILAPAPPGEEGVSFQREPAYRSVVAVNLGAEYQVPGVPLRVRAGFFTEPLPYRLIAADTDFEFVPDDNDPNTTDDTSAIYRDYPVADIVSDRKYWTVGAGVLIQDALSLDAAVVVGSWERRTPAGYENGTDYYPTVPTVEKVTQTRVFVTSTFHFE